MYNPLAAWLKSVEVHTYVARFVVCSSFERNDVKKRIAGIAH